MEFKNFNEFYNKANDLAKQAIKRQSNLKQAVVFARKSFSKTDLNSFYIIGNLHKKQINTLNAKTAVIKFSVDSLIKNILEHSDLDFEDYKKINFILNNPDDIILGTCNHLRYFKVIDEKLYEVIIKNTYDNKENFLLSLYRSDVSKLKNLKLKRLKR